jgi:hypothetical protein
MKFLVISYVPIFTGMGGGRTKENDGGVNSSMIQLICCKCHNVPPLPKMKKLIMRLKKSIV